MVIEIKVPDIGIDEVEVTKLLVSLGDQVKTDQAIITVEGNKASMVVPTPLAGTVKAIPINIGDKVRTGSLIMLLETVSQKQKSASTDHLQQQTTQILSGFKREVILPDIGSDEVEVTEIMVKIGDKITADQALITVEGNKASMEVPAPFAGTIKDIKIKIGDKINTNSGIMIVEVPNETTMATNSAAQYYTSHKNATGGRSQQNSVGASNRSSNNKVISENNDSKDTKNTEKDNNAKDADVHATPMIRRLARKFGINLAKVKGTGHKKRILYEDIQQYLQDAVKRAESLSDINYGDSNFSQLVWPKVNFSQFGAIEEIALSRIQKISGSNLHRNWLQIPHVTQFDEADITDMEAFRTQQNAEAEKNKLEVKITPLVFIMKAVAKALEELPRFNSSLSAEATKLTLKKYINIGVAVDTPTSLVVPVVQQVNKKGIMELSRELIALSTKARAGKLTSADMQGGCFSISSLGGIGGTAFTPIVNAPEVAILGVSKSSMKPVWNGKEFMPRLILPLSLSYDHRVIDGADGVRFIRFIKNVMSDIRYLIM